MKNKKTIFVGLSGGVDSAVSALLLKQQGFHVIGIYMWNWDKEINGDFFGNKNNSELGCSNKQDYKDAKRVAEQLGIKLIKLNLVKEYWDLVFKKTLNEYSKALTPNPDILCNRYIKFGILKEYINKYYSNAYLATGHYAKIEHKNDLNYLSIPMDKNKDQTYFLCCLKNEQLNNVIFPLSNLLKIQVRKIAIKHKLIVANKKDSTGICFIGERKFKEFLQNYFKKNSGEIMLLPDNKVIGKHDGLFFYTIGQRHGLNIGGLQEKIFVVGKNIKKNILYVTSESQKNKYLSTNYVYLDKFNWILPWEDKINFKQVYYIRFRHRQKLISCYFKKKSNKKVELFYPETSLAVTPGQYAAIYTTNDICIGGGKIMKCKLINKQEYNE